MTVEHLVGRSQGGYLKEIRVAVSHRFADLSEVAREQISRQIDAANTVTACSFCNSTTSRDINYKTMPELLHEAQGNPAEVLAHINAELMLVLVQKQRVVQWKLVSVREAFQREVHAKLSNSEGHSCQTVGTSIDTQPDAPNSQWIENVKNQSSENESVEIFDGDDHAYLAWIAEHPGSYVLTSNRSFSPRHTVIHRATCTPIRTLKGNAQPGGFTKKYIKVCAHSIATLQAWAIQERSDAKTRECILCAGR